MKTSEIKIGTVYLIDRSPNWAEGRGYPQQGVVLGTEYFSRNFRFPSKTQGYGKKTGVLVLVHGWVAAGTERAPVEDVLKLTEADVAKPNAELPKGWTWSVVQPSAVRETWEAWLKRAAQIKAAREEAAKQREAYRRQRDESYRLKQEARERVLAFVEAYESWPDQLDANAELEAVLSADRTQLHKLTVSDLKLALGVK